MDGELKLRRLPSLPWSLHRRGPLGSIFDVASSCGVPSILVPASPPLVAREAAAKPIAASTSQSTSAARPAKETRPERDTRRAVASFLTRSRPRTHLVQSLEWPTDGEPAAAKTPAMMRVRSSHRTQEGKQ